MGGWPGEYRTNNMLVYTAWMQMIDWGHKLGEFARQKASYLQPCFVEKIGGFTLRSIITPRGEVFDLAPPCLGLMCATLLWPHLLCFAAASLQILILKVQTSSPRRRTADSTAEQRESALLRLPLLLWKLGKMREEGGKKGMLGSWSSSHLLNSCAARWAKVQRHLNICMSVWFISS